jgi:aromatic ring hydroxylase-like protein
MPGPCTGKPDAPGFTGRESGREPRDGEWVLPVIGAVPAPPAALIRPDGHVVWAGEPTDPELPRALETWFGEAAPAGR